jgi:VanZ family protein
MVQTLIIATAWALIAFVVYATISPMRNRPTLAIPPVLEHVAAFAVLGTFFCLAYPEHIVFVCLIIFGSAVLLEIIQIFIPDRHGRFRDAIEKMIGAAIGISVGQTILYFEQVDHWFQN